MTLFVPLADLIDPVEESLRLEKEIQKLGRDIAQVSAKLSNRNFIERAPANVVDKERSKLTDLQAALEKLQAQHERIKILVK